MSSSTCWARLTLTLSAGVVACSVAACSGNVDEPAGSEAGPDPVLGQRPDGGGALADGGAIDLDAAGALLDGSSVGADGALEASAPLDDAQAMAPDGASQPDAAAPQGNPLFMAWGSGGWRALSCDRGRSWTVRQQSAERNDESEWSAFAGITWGQGTFVAARGWGTGGRLFWFSGLTPNDAMLDFQGGVSHVGFTGSELVAFGATRQFRSGDGGTWSPAVQTQYPAGVQHVRKMRLFALGAGLGIAVINNDAGRRWIIRSEDGGRSWSEAQGDISSCSDDIQRRGDIAQAGGTLLLAGRQAGVCRSSDAGRSWQAAASLPSGEVLELWSDGQNFFALADGKVYRLSGSSWEMLGSVALWGEGAGAAGGGTHVLTNGGKFFYSDDARSWQEASLTADPGTLNSPYVRDMAVGYAGSCP